MEMTVEFEREEVQAAMQLEYEKRFGPVPEGYQIAVSLPGYGSTKVRLWKPTEEPPSDSENAELTEGGD